MIRESKQVGLTRALPHSLYPGFTETNGVITTTMFDVPGYRVVRVLGTVYGLTVRSRNWAAGLGMVLKSIAGGELRWFTNMVCASSLYFFLSRLGLCCPGYCQIWLGGKHRGKSET